MEGTFETSSGEETQATVDLDSAGKATVKQSIPGMSAVGVNHPEDEKPPEKTPLTAAEVQAEIDKQVAEGDAEAEAEAKGDKPKAEEPAKPQPTGEPVEDLGEFKPEDPAVAAKFHERYFADGSLNPEALSAEFWGNATSESAGTLHESTYEYLKHQLGVSKEFIKDLEAGLVAKAQAATSGLVAKVHAAAGSSDVYNAAISWASGGAIGPDGKPIPPGYTPEQGERLNKAIRNQVEGWEDHVEALVSRFHKANPQAAAGGPKVPPGPPARRSTPARQAGQEHPSVKPPVKKEEAAKKEPESNAPPFKDADEYLAALKEAGADPVKAAAVRARLKASKNVRM